jgi:phosphoserine / homoserine phosphotransferase
MRILCLDFEGVLVPEVWIAFAEKTGIPELRATTRDIPDYDVLMRQRLQILAQNGLTLAQIQEVIGAMRPLPGAVDFLNWARQHFQPMIISDTFYEFGLPLTAQFGYPPLLCHKLSVDERDMVVNYHLRQQDPKPKCVQAFQQLDFSVIAAGDSYNDVTMLKQADHGILFKPPQNVIDEFPQFPVVTNYEAFKQALLEIE